MKITVYFESRTHAEIAAVFPDEYIYDACFPALEKIAKEARMIVTESVEEKEDLWPNTQCISEAITSTLM